MKNRKGRAIKALLGLEVLALIGVVALIVLKELNIFSLF